MTIRPILIRGEQPLATAAVPVTEFDDDLVRLIEDLYETNAAANGAGLAANQIGDPRSVFIYDCPDSTGTRHRGHVVNPVLRTSEIPGTMPHPDDDLEGCLSVPGEVFPTGRARWAAVDGLDEHGAPITVEGTGYFARCLQHETDHLAGVLYLERLVGRHTRGAKRMLKRNGWTGPGHTWLPGTVPDPFGH